MSLLYTNSAEKCKFFENSAEFTFHKLNGIFELIKNYLKIKQIGIKWRSGRDSNPRPPA